MGLRPVIGDQLPFRRSPFSASFNHASFHLWFADSSIPHLRVGLSFAYSISYSIHLAELCSFPPPPKKIIQLFCFLQIQRHYNVQTDPLRLRYA